MGWKSVKDHYRIRHLVSVAPECICIGSGYIHDLIVIGPQGRITKRDEGRSNEDLRRYQAEMDADPQLLARLVGQADVFARAITVYTFEDGRVLEKQCEELGWPNVTHDGCPMYENTFSADRAEVVKWALRDCELAVQFTKESIERGEAEVARWRERLAQHEADLQALRADKGLEIPPEADDASAVDSSPTPGEQA
ncbi:MAG: hypothetical protein K0Q43_240 [Ramlibacter sp.]|jgi:hypothetical protein|nr:hypothetical protein [Ramlibacter sp.]